MKRLVQKAAMCSLAATMMIMGSFTSLAGTWKQDTKGWKWQEDNGSCPASAWREIGGKWYYFGADAYMTANQWIGNYYVGADGAMLVDTTTPDGYRVGADGAWIADAAKKSGEIVSVVDVKALGNLYFMDNGIGDLYVAQNMDNGRYEYYDKNFNLQFTIPWNINGNEILRPTSFSDGVTVVATHSEYGYPIYNYDAFDGNGNHVYSFGALSDAYRFKIGQDANGMTMFAWANHTDALRFVSYSSATGFIEKIYYYTDHPELEKVNTLFGFENGKANLVGRTITRIENEGYVNQRTYYEDENVASIDTLGNLGAPIPLMKERQNVTDDSVSNFGTSLGDRGAYFEADGADIVLRDVTGAEKFRTDGSAVMQVLGGYIDVVDENYFLARPKGASFESPIHLYQIIYK